MITADALLMNIALQLNDAEDGHAFTTWSQELLLIWLNEAMCLIATISPQHFVEDKTIKLEQGSRQELGGCSSVRAVLGQATKDGVLLDTPITQYNADLMRRWTQRKCEVQASSKYRIKGYSYDVKEGGILNIYPPVPPGVDVYVKVACNTQPDVIDLDTDIDEKCIVVTAAVHWVMFEAFLQDTESPASTRLAQTHMGLFFQMLSIEASRALLQTVGFNTLSERVKEALIQKVI